jgi:uncharacterized protein
MVRDPAHETFATGGPAWPERVTGQAPRACAGSEPPAGPGDGKGDTLLMPTAYYGHAETVRMHVTSGADLDRADGRGRRSFAGAVFKKESAVVRAPLAAGAESRAGRAPAVATAQMFANDQFIQCFTQSDS